ncbi:SDR family NAD(P)-dependent oxidoreductase [Pseudohalioglobus lutimaris]|uniref:KR domain-containing protein n=1 Tax=Pseudohalioglobus lutimaris TaxID=1737061 RepID=A0A2N5WXI6_9GAMM|nr:SDR family NAD(P)-dependent oxidoreductase [Pseudohalioglobus lutimaris]PLW66943.1 KR domain-containing protein [Pseudohalioglobus lutimaris]
MQLEKRFPDQRAFITGAASGLGLEICRQLAGRKWKLFIADINAQRLSEVENQLIELGAEVIVRVLDVTRPEDLEAACGEVEQAWGGVDLVFNNAGIAVAGELNEVALEDWHRVINVDLWGVIHGCRAFVPLLKKQGAGHIINTASSAGTLSAPEMGPYNVAKAGVISLSETLRVELSRSSVGVTVVCPTVFASSLGESFGESTRGEQMLHKQLNQSRVTAREIVEDVLKAVERERLYVMTQPDARWGWRMKRLFPEYFASSLGRMYRDRKGIFSEDKF